MLRRLTTIIAIYIVTAAVRVNIDGLAARNNETYSQNSEEHEENPQALHKETHVPSQGIGPVTHIFLLFRVYFYLPDTFLTIAYIARKW